MLQLSWMRVPSILGTERSDSHVNNFRDPGKTITRSVRHFTPSAREKSSRGTTTTFHRIHQFPMLDQPSGPKAAMWFGAADQPTWSPIRLYDGVIESDRITIGVWQPGEPIQGGGVSRERHVTWSPLEYWTTPSSGAGFLQNPGQAAFPAQHIYHWASRAWELADLLLGFHPPFSPDTLRTGVTVIANAPMTDRTTTGDGGCWSFDLRHPEHGNTDASSRRRGFNWAPCIRFDARSGYRQKGVQDIAVIYHELGHAIEWKYMGGRARSGTWKGAEPCEPRTSDEGKALSEAVAGMLTMAFLELDFSSHAWMNYWGYGDYVIGHTVASANVDDLEAYYSRGSRLLHANVGNCKDDGAFYRYGGPMLQAYWQILKRINCSPLEEGRLCRETAQYANNWQAVHSLMHAIRTTGNMGTFSDFASNMLGYFLNEGLFDALMDAWEVFANHGIVPPNA